MPIILKSVFKKSAIRAAVCLLFFTVLSLAVTAQGKNPVVVIPGLTGSELVSTKNGAVVWFNVRRSRTDDLSLPISPNIAANRDSLEPRDILRSIKIGILPRTDAYQGLLEALETRGGYREGKWDNPPVKGYQDTIYVFPYDWRRDNVENARLLIRKIETLKRRLKRPNLKFDVVAHSMGGLIARYAAMYGDADLPSGTQRARPTWAGARNFDKIILLGTPNQGSVTALSSLLNGFSVFGINLPFIQKLSKFDLFTIPSGYQLLPFDGTLKVYDEDLKPLKLDLYNPETWSEYGWNAIDDKDFSKRFSSSEQQSAKAYFVAVLDRAKRFQDSLNAVSAASPVSINIMGAECRDTLDGVVVFQDSKSGKFKTIFKPEAFTTSTGKKVTADEVKGVMYTPGDGVVAKSSLTTSSLSMVGEIKDIMFPLPATFVCEDHNRLPASPEIQNDILGLLTGVKPANAAPVKAAAALR